MDKKLKVYLQYPLFRSDSQYYKSLIDNSPKNVSYEVSHKNSGIGTSNKKIQLIRRIKLFIRWVLNKTSFPMISSFYVKSAENYDLIHCAHCLCVNKSPWVVDVEFPSQLWGGVKLTSKRKNFVKKLITSKNCKKILAWTNVVKDQILKDFPEVKNKIEVLTYAMPFPKFKKITSGKINLLFTARYFDGKGGFDAVEVIDQLTKKYNQVYGTVISNVPEEILKKYSKNNKIKFYGLMPYKKIVEEIYPVSDIYIYPGYTDSFGFTFVEAQAFGIPIITVEDGFSRKELVEDGKTGFVLSREGYRSYYHLNPKLVERLVEKTEILIKNSKLRKSFSKNGLKMVRGGKFSLTERNKKLSRIYNESIK